jgi:hypothetical protein
MNLAANFVLLLVCAGVTGAISFVLATAAPVLYQPP